MTMLQGALELKRWQDLSPADQARVRALTIPPQQIEYAGTLERAIAACEAAAPDVVAGLAILLGDEPVGFAVLNRGERLPDWAPADSVALTAMRIDAAQQGRGLGQAALRAVDGWLLAHWPENRRAALCVDDANAAGRRAYEKAGYCEFCEPREGRIGLVRYLAKPLAEALPVAGRSIPAPYGEKLPHLQE